MIKKCCNILIQFGIILLIIFPPLVLGAVESRHITSIQIILIALWCIWLVKTFVKGSFTYIQTPVDLPMALFIGLGCVNLLTSTATHSTENELYLLVNYVVLYFILVQQLKTTRRILGLASIILLIGSGETLFGLFQYLGGATTVLGRMTPNIGTLNATYMNHNHFAGFLILIIPIALGLLIGVSHHEKRIFFVLLTCLLGTGLILTLSRGGILSLMVASGCFFLCLAVKMRQTGASRFFLTLPLLLVLCIGLLIGWIGISRISHRGIFETFLPSQEILEEEIRIPLWRNSLELVKESPLAGSGLGTFEYVSLRYRPEEIPLEKHAYRAHNDYLELLIEMGIPGLLVVLWGIWRFSRYILKGYFRYNNSLLTALLLGGFTSCLAMFIHSFFDFNLQIPANALLFFTVLALTSATLQLLNLRYERSQKKYTITTSWQFIIIVVCITGILGFNFRKNIAMRYFREARISQFQGELFSPIALYQKAIACNSRNPSLHEELGTHYFTLGQSRPHAEKWFLLAVDEYQKASDLNRFNPVYYYHLGWANSALGRETEAFQAFEKAIEYSPKVSVYYENLGKFLFSIDQPEAGMRRFKKALDINPAIMSEILNFYTDQTLSYAEYQNAIPDTAPLRKQFAVWLLQHNLWDESKIEYRKAIEFSDGQPEYYDGLLQACRQRKDHDCLREVWRELAERQPENWEFVRQIAESYAGQQQWDTALREYEALFKQFPENPEIYNRIGQLYQQSGRWEDAVHHYQYLIEQYSGHIEFYHALAGIYRRQNQWQEAVDVYRNAVDSGLTLPEVYAELGILHEQIGAPEQALTAYEQAVQSGERRFNIYQRLANLYEHHNQSAQTPLLWTMYVVANAQQPQALFTLVQHYHAQGEWLNAVKLTKEVIANAPTHVEYRIFLANLYAQQQMTHEAIEQWEKIVTLNAGNVQYHVQLASLYEKVNDWSRARAQYRRILRIAPGHEQAQQKLAALGG